MWVKVVFAKYLTKGDFLEVKKTAKAFIMWKYVLDHRYLIRKGLCWIFRNVERINFWHDIWLKESSLTRKFPLIIDQLFRILLR